MALAAHTTHTAAGLGLDEGTRPELVDFGASNLSCLNVRQGKRGELGKRNGFTALSTLRLDASSATAGYKMFADRDTIARITETPNLEVYSSALSRWQSLGRVPEAGCRLIDVPSMGASTYFEDVDATNGYLALSWLSIPNPATSIDAYIAILDQATGSIVRVPEKVGTSTSFGAAFLAVQGNYFITVRPDTGGASLLAHYLDTTSAATIATGWVAFGTALCTDSNYGFVLHSLPHASTPRVAMLYVNTSGGASRLTLKTFNVASGVLETQTIGTGGVTPNAFALGGIATDTLWATWNQATGVRAMGVSPFAITATALATTSTIIAMATGCNYLGIAASTTAGKARVWAADTNATLRGWMRGIQTSAGATATDGSQIEVPGVSMVRRPFFYGGRYYSAFFQNNFTDDRQENAIVCDWTDDYSLLRPIANPAPGLASLGLYAQGKFVAGSTSSKLFVGIGVTRSGVAAGSALCELDFASTKRWQPCAWGNSAYLSGGLASYFDGARVAEVGFLIRPSLPVTSTSSTGITAATGWKYVCVYEEVDADGNWHQSGLSLPSASTGAVANKTVTVSTTPLVITSRMSTAAAGARAVRVAFYRTLDGGETPYYRLGTTINDSSNTAVTYDDTTTDAALASAAKLYSQPGVNGTAQDKRPPPPFQCVVSYNGMIVGASGSDVWYSGQNVSGEGAWFNPIFQVPVPGDGDITALWVQDGTLYAAKRREIYALSGEAPSDNGTSGGLGLPRRLAVDVGCIEARSTCATALGVFFQSERGIEILTRAQSVEWIGESVQDTLTSFPVVTSATVDPVSCTVLVECAASEASGLVTGNGRTLVYDLSLKTWVSCDRRKSSGGTADTPSQSACMIYTGSAYRYAWLSAAGVVCHESTSYTDADGSFVTAQYETAWLKHGLQQEQRVWAGTILFEQESAAGLTIEVAYDYAAYAGADDKTWAEALTLGKRQLEWRPKSRGQAMKFRIKDTAPAVLGTGQGFTFIGMSFDLAQKQGATKGTLRIDTAGRK